MNIFYYKLFCFSFPVLSSTMLITDQKTEENDYTKKASLCFNGGLLDKPNWVENLPPPIFRKGVGNSHFKISTQSAEAQKWFDQGINLLHGFWYFEAYRAFKEVLKHDPACAMGYWGLAMCKFGFGGQPSPWVQSIEKAISLKMMVSPLEKDLIEASDILIKKGFYNATDAFGSLLDKYPDEVEILAFSAIVLRQGGLDAFMLDDLKKRVEESLTKHPNHVGLQHYFVHLMETRPDFIDAKEIAEQMVKNAPNASHIQHMPGHIYFLEGNYVKAIEVFEKATAIERRYHQQEKIPYGVDENYVHNLQYLTLAYSELGQKDMALVAAQAISSIALTTPIDEALANSTTLVLLYEGRIMPALVYGRFGEYKKASEKVDFWLNSLDFPLTNPFVHAYLSTLKYYYLTMDAAVAEHSSDAKKYFSLLEKSNGVLLNMNSQAPIKHSLLKDALETIKIRYLEAQGWVSNMDKMNAFDNTAWAKAKAIEDELPYDEPPKVFYPVAESLARLHYKRNEKEQAQKAQAWALYKRPKSILIEQIL